MLRRNEYTDRTIPMGANCAGGTNETDTKPSSLSATQRYPILWKTGLRGKDPLEAMTEDWLWEEKRPRAVWRGHYEGKLANLGINQGPSRHGRESLVLTDKNCRNDRRCNFVLDHIATSLHFDLGFVNLPSGSGSRVNGIKLGRHPLPKFHQLRNKIVICLEGTNEVAQNLPWMLLSRSVVLMSPPTKSSWLMEELLEPWVHYVPMEVDGSNAQERVDWVIAHDDDARKIAERATLFMFDLLYHPDAQDDEQKIREEVLKRYFSQ